MAERLLDEEEASEILGISIYTLQGLRKAGLISYIQISPRIVKYTISQLEEYQLKHLRRATQ
ncbi:MAG TPA: helix-turn-helix domain-containing protein [Pyrinomonadaceae bacterium]|jgi:predicted site-specific integrase-resolvase